MGEVVLAEHIGLGKRVVVKLLHEALADDPGNTLRMQIEARSVAALASPHIVQVTDFGQSAKGRTYIVMERLIGRTLGAELKERGALQCSEAIDYIMQVLAGLHTAHAMGIIHRDIKPENIFLCDATKDFPRTVKILDFGVAKILSVASDAGRPALPHLVTEEGSVCGTARVVAPEQALARPVDGRTDVYATGLLLYTLVVGTGPFAHIRDPIELLKANVNDRPAPPAERAAQPIPPALNAAILRAIEKQPEDRFQSAEDFANTLRRIAAELSGTHARQDPAGERSGLCAAMPPVPPPRPEERTMRLAVCPGMVEDRPVFRDPGERSDTGSLPPPPEELRAPGPASTPSGWGTFIALVLVSAAISGMLLTTLYRVMGP